MPTDTIPSAVPAPIPSPFRPPWWLRNAHAQTLWGSVLRRSPALDLTWEVFDLPDGDFVEVAWVDRETAPSAPTVLVLHGLTGSVQSKPVRGLLQAFSNLGWHAGCFHFRGCGRGPNRTAIGYHSGKTDDPRHVLATLRGRSEGPLAVAGVSLGANVLLKLLGEDGATAPVDAAVAISPPLRLRPCVDRMERGLSQLYQAHLLRRLVAGVREKVPLPVDAAALARCRTFREFDDLVTAPLHGFRDAEDYYQRASSTPFLLGIRTPTLVIHARDDPFFTPEVVPTAAELPDTVRFELSPTGGHVGFVGGASRYHLDTRVPEWLAPHLAR
ncbi:MAG: putative alpha/beta-fold hydrolase [Myxococcota bacterium]